MTALSPAFVITEPRPSLPSNFSSGASMKSADPLVWSTNLTTGFKGMRKLSNQKRALSIQASYSDSGRPNNAGIFIGGFVLGGLIVGTLGCVYAPQISYALSGTDRRDLMKKLPKFIYDEDKAIERQRKKLTEKIEQLSSAIDNMSSQLRSNDPPNEAEASIDDIEAHA